MVWGHAKQAVKRFLKGLDKRHLQQQIDTHKLFLLTSFHHQGQGGVNLQQLSEKLSEAALETPYEEQKRLVDFNVLHQVCDISRCIHSALRANADPCHPAMALLREAEEKRQEAEMTAALLSEVVEGKRPQGRGLAIAVGRRDDFDRLVTSPPLVGLEPLERAPELPQTQHNSSEQSLISLDSQPDNEVLTERILDINELAEAFQARTGFALHIKASQQAKGQSGNGLWIRGQAGVGSVVALYPGLVYTPNNYRHMPGYPLIDQSNDYLMARYDKAVLDAKPWCNAQQREQQEEVVQPDGKTSSTEDIRLQALEIRHPLAMAQYANHPSKGCEPNVVPAPFDFHPSHVEGGHCIRAYIPNVMVTRSEPEEVWQQEIDTAGLALIATRPLQDEEILLNYRLSTHVERPDWYHPVDRAEDERRWG